MHGLPIYVRISFLSTVKTFYIHFRDDGIIFAVTFWQWIWELLISLVIAPLAFNMWFIEHRFLEHLLLLTITFLSYVLFPSFCLMADRKFRREVKEKGFVKGVFLAFTQKI